LFKNAQQLIYVCMCGRHFKHSLFERMHTIHQCMTVYFNTNKKFTLQKTERDAVAQLYKKTTTRSLNVTVAN